jgi:hypothetical protein
MGIFSMDKTTTNQTAYNQQAAVSNRDLSGLQVTTGAQGVSQTDVRTVSGGQQVNAAGAKSVIVNDPSALNAAAGLINNAISANESTTQSSLAGFQNALGIVAEHQQTAADLATGQQNTTLGQLGISPGQIVTGLALIFAGLIATAYFKHK